MSTDATPRPTTPSPVGLLAHRGHRHQAHPALWGFGGFHGGLALSLVTTAMAAEETTGVLRSVTARFHRPLRKEFLVETGVQRAGQAVTVRTGRIVTGAAGSAAVTADAIWASVRPGGSDGEPVTPPAPPAPPASDCDVLTIPAELVPFARYTEIRPVGDARPFAAGSEPELTAWVRLTDDDHPPDVHRLMILLDALAPSYAAVLPVPVAIPTVELTVRPVPGPSAPAPWVLLHARTVAATSDGWIDERIDAWSPDGRHLATATQLRLLRAGRR